MEQSIAQGLQESISVVMLGIRLLLAGIVTILCWKMSRLEFAVSLTWHLKAVGYANLTGAWLLTFFFRERIIPLYADFPPLAVWLSQIFTTVFIICLTLSYIRIYRAAKGVKTVNPIPKKK